jgi:hypothetical protein
MGLKHGNKVVSRCGNLHSCLYMPCARLAQWPEEGANFSGEGARLLKSSETATGGHGRPAPDVEHAF